MEPSVPTLRSVPLTACSPERTSRMPTQQCPYFGPRIRYYPVYTVYYHYVRYTLIEVPNPPLSLIAVVSLPILHIRYVTGPTH